MKGHGGAISLYSEVGKGTVFNLYFPAAGEIKAEPAAPLKDLKMPTGGLRVMYVDDEEALVNLAGRALRRMGYQVAGFTDPREALQAFTATPDAFDIVVTDLAMPHITGFELVRKLQAVRPEIPIVLTSGYVRPADEELAAEYGVRDIVLKPNSVEDLGHVLDRLFRGSGSPPVAPESVRLPK
jgi:CheY-like chemotaxis protein